jgi:hypothetical protein
MKAQLLARITLYPPTDGGRSTATPPKTFSCPLFFENLSGLEAHGYDCRMDLSGIGPLVPGSMKEDVPLAFLSAGEVLPHMRPGVRFKLWEGRNIGEGEVLAVL